MLGCRSSLQEEEEEEEEEAEEEAARLAYERALQHDADEQLTGPFNDDMGSKKTRRFSLYFGDNSLDGSCGCSRQEKDVEAEEEQGLVEQALEPSRYSHVAFMPETVDYCQLSKPKKGSESFNKRTCWPSPAGRTSRYWR